MSKIEELLAQQQQLAAQIEAARSGVGVSEEASVNSKKEKEEVGWFNRAVKAAILNSLWLGPLNIAFWFQNDRFSDPYYAREALIANTHLDAIIGAVLFYEMLLLVLSLFSVYSIFMLAKAQMNAFMWIFFFVLATVLWTGLSMLFGL